MTLQKARKILKDNGIIWSTYFDLDYILKNTNNAEVRKAIIRIRMYIFSGIK